MLAMTLLLGGLTFHPMNPDSNNFEAIGPAGMIYNPYSIVMLGGSEFKGGLIYGRDSIGEPIRGPVVSYSFDDNVSLVAGFYADNGHNDLKFKLGKGDYTPLLGFDVHFKLYEQGNFAIESHNVISVITTHSIGCTVSF